MSTLSHKIDSLQRDAKQAVRKASPWIGFLARFGFATRGLLYVILGALALLYAIGHGGKTTNVRGAMYTLFHQPLGTILLLGACIGLAGYALWSFIQALLDPDHFGSSFKGLARRFGCFCTGCIYGALLCAAAALLIGVGRDEPPEPLRDWTAKLMSFPAGIWLVAAIGIGVIIFGIVQLRLVFRRQLDRRLVLDGMSPAIQRSIMIVCRFGVAARGVVFTLIGLFLVVAAIRANPDEARGIGQAMHALREEPYGQWLLGVVAAGLIAYGVYQFILACYRRVNP